MHRNKEEIIRSVRYNIDDAILEVKAMINANDGVGVSHWSAFILCSCIIDYLAGYRYAAEKSRGTRYKRFIEEYLNKADSGHQYDKDDIYHWLRCGMVHGYTDVYEGKTKFLFTHLYPGCHLKLLRFKASTGEVGERTAIRLQEFLNDIEVASELLFEEAFNAEIDDEILISMEKRVNEVGVKRSDFEIGG
ncbi:MAG: hypothetical protein HQ596_07725 [Candidatus Saganbacteria bacterium]|nr:hypothetical protein [Candidatus Saganbacteria bacterium]